MLGSSRTLMQAGQTTPCYDADFYPFGGEKQYTNTCPQNYKFEGKERDAEAGNDALFASRMGLRDDFGARYYSSVYGRWLSPDWSSVPAPVPYANLTNPQTLNLYAMVSDNPESFADLNGHFRSGMYDWFASMCNSALYSSMLSFLNYSEQQYIDAQNASSPAGQAAQQESTAAYAENQVGSSEYELDKTNGNYKAGEDKCNEFAADAIEKSGKPRPQVGYTGLKGWVAGIFGKTRDPSSNEWANPNVHIPGWSSPKPVSEAKRGDVIAQQHNEKGSWGHVGIVVGPHSTVSVNSTTTPPGLVTRNDWGFRPHGQNGEGPHDPAVVVRHYIGVSP